MKDIASMIGRAIGRIGKAWDQAMCRHDDHWAYEKERTFLKCAKCKRETPGWDMTGMTPPTPRFTGDPERHRTGRVK